MKNSFKLKILNAVILFSSSTILYAQQQDDRQASCFEWSFSGTYLTYKLTPTDWKSEFVNYADSISSITVSNKIGCGFGLLKNFEITPSIIVRTGVQLRFFNSILHFTIVGEKQELNFNIVSPSIPLSFIYLFNNNTRKPVPVKPYLVLGGRYSLAVLRESTEKLIDYEPSDVLADAGIGVHLYGKKKHIMALEFIYSKGFLNMKSAAEKRNIYNSTLKDLYKQTFMLTINLS